MMDVLQFSKSIHCVSLLVLLACLMKEGSSADEASIPCGDDTLVRRPGVLRTTRGRTVTFAWELGRNTSRFAFAEIIYNRTNAITVTMFGPVVTDIFRQRILVSDSAPPNVLEFNLTNVQPQDTMGPFRLSSQFGACTDDAFVSIFNYPRLPDITSSDLLITPGFDIEVSSGDTITLVCQSHLERTNFTQPLEYSWTVGNQTLGSSNQNPRYQCSGEGNQNLTIINVTLGQDDEITCTASESESPLWSNGTTIRLVIIVNKDEGEDDTSTNSTMPGGGSSSGNNGLSDETMVYIYIGVVAVVVIIIALAVAVGYLTWEKKKRPERSRERTEKIRRSLTFDKLRRHRTSLGMTRDYVSEVDPDNDTVYDCIRNSAVQSTLLVDERGPTLPRRRELTYDYADPDRLLLRSRPRQNQQEQANDDLGYASTTEDLERAIKQEVDEYATGFDSELPVRNTAKEDENQQPMKSSSVDDVDGGHVSNVYAKPNKRKPRVSLSAATPEPTANQPNVDDIDDTDLSENPSYVAADPSELLNNNSAPTNHDQKLRETGQRAANNATHMADRDLYSFATVEADPSNENTQPSDTTKQNGCLTHAPGEMPTNTDIYSTAQRLSGTSDGSEPGGVTPEPSHSPDDALRNTDIYSTAQRLSNSSDVIDNDPVRDTDIYFVAGTTMDN